LQASDLIGVPGLHVCRLHGYRAFFFSTFREDVQSDKTTSVYSRRRAIPGGRKSILSCFGQVLSDSLLEHGVVHSCAFAAKQTQVPYQRRLADGLLRAAGWLPAGCGGMHDDRALGTFMAHLGILCVVGTRVPDTGRYQHSACADTRVLYKGKVVAPCANPDCRDKGANWVLQEKHE
jgi:hypothetical protein